MRGIKRFLAGILLAAMLCIPAQAKEVGVFSDVPSGNWAYNNIRFAAKYNLMQGIGGGKFGLGMEMSRAAYVSALCRLMKWSTVNPAAGSFTDNQDPQKWYFSAMETAYANGALTRQSDTCRPLEAITREEASVMLVRALGYSTLAGLVQEECPFSDASTNQGYITLAYRMGIVTGLDAVTFKPNLALTREEAATILLRAYDRRYAGVAQSSAAAPKGAVRAESVTAVSGSVPMSPRASLEAVYDAAVKAGNGGAVVLSAKPLSQTAKDGVFSEGTELTQEQLSALLADKTVEQHRSVRYESSYLLYRESDGTLTSVWYESSKDLTVKINLCRMLGIQTVYIEK